MSKQHKIPADRLVRIPLYLTPMQPALATLALPDIAALVDAAIVYKDERMKLDDTPAFCDLTAALSAITKEPR